MIKKQAHCPRVVGPPKSFILYKYKNYFYMLQIYQKRF